MYAHETGILERVLKRIDRRQNAGIVRCGIKESVLSGMNSSKTSGGKSAPGCLARRGWCGDNRAVEEREG